MKISINIKTLRANNSKVNFVTYSLHTLQLWLELFLTWNKSKKNLGNNKSRNKEK